MPLESPSHCRVEYYYYHQKNESCETPQAAGCLQTQWASQPRAPVLYLSELPRGCWKLVVHGVAARQGVYQLGQHCQPDSVSNTSATLIILPAIWHTYTQDAAVLQYKSGSWWIFSMLRNGLTVVIDRHTHTHTYTKTIYTGHTKFGAIRCKLCFFPQRCSLITIKKAANVLVTLISSLTDWSIIQSDSSFASSCSFTRTLSSRSVLFNLSFLWCSCDIPAIRSLCM